MKGYDQPNHTPVRLFIVRRTENRAGIDFSRNESLAERKKEKRNCFLPGYIYFIFGPLGITAFILGFYFPPLTSINNYGQTQDYGQNTHPRVYRRKCLSQPPEEILHNVTILVVISAHLFLRKFRAYLSSLCLLASYRFGEVTGCYSKTLNSH